MMSTLNVPTQHGGIVVPLDMFRASHLAGIVSEVLVGKARNILDAKMVITRHPASQIVLITINGSVIDGEPAKFWKENADLAIAMSQVLRTQCFLYYAKTAPADERREGFVVAQRGQALAADDATADSQPATGEGHWPVAKLCEQLRITMDDLATGFAGGPSVELSVMEPSIDDQAALMTLAGQPGEGGEAAEAGDSADANKPGEATDGTPAADADKPKKLTLEDDLKRRANEKAAEADAMEQRAENARADLEVAMDDLGIVVCPKAELGEPDILAPFIIGEINGDLPPGVPREHIGALQGKRSDIAVAVDFLSEVLVGNNPLSRKGFDETAKPASIAGKEVRAMEVLAPRLGYGVLISAGKAPHVFVSRRAGMALPEAMISRLLAG